MRLEHKTHVLDKFPVYSSTFISDNQIVLGGGGGASKSGIKNKLRLIRVKADLSIESEGEYELTKGEDAPMSMAAPLEAGRLVCGINSSPEQLVNGPNDNCRAFQVQDKSITLVKTQSTLTLKDEDDDFQKVTVFSSDNELLAAGGSHSLHLLAYPSLIPVCAPVSTKQELYDATFTNDKLVIATTANLQVYPITEVGGLPEKTKKKGKQKAQSTEASTLDLERTIELPSSLGGGSGGSFRSVRQHPKNAEVLYTVVNTAPSRTRSKSTSRQGYICKWNTKNWTMEKSRKVGDRGLTCFSLSPDGRFIGYGSSDLSIGILDANTLATVATILKAHDFPPTTLVFNPTSKLLASSSADNSIRVVRVPDQVGSSGWGWSILLFLIAVLVATIAFAIQKNLLQ
ncbi:WD40 repeat-like protein [Marasmius fiardii PR-910]|nr:WD40 repeat-like protein [Marasmius fiardii PR-910]